MQVNYTHHDHLALYARECDRRVSRRRALNILAVTAIITLPTVVAGYAGSLPGYYLDSPVLTSGGLVAACLASMTFMTIAIIRVVR